MDNSGQDAIIPSILDLYLKLVPVVFFVGLVKRLHLRRHRGIFTAPVVVWLMMFQSLHDKGTLSVGVQHVIRGLPSALLSRRSKRVRRRKISCHTGGYNQARQKLPLEAVRKVNQEIFQQLMEAKPKRPDPQMFILDGSTLLMPHTPSLLAVYPPSHNQYGQSHWPIMRVLVAHDVDNGIAVCPQWGPVNGAKAVSEQGLTEQLLDQLPPGAGVMGDRNFGVFSVAWSAQQRMRPVLLRLTTVRAQSAFGRGLCSGTDRTVEWNPSKSDHRKHPGLPVDGCVRGRLIVRNVYSSDGKRFKLYLFTTLDLPADEVVQLYGLRWNVETDLRTIKKTIRLEMLRCKKPDMVAKELILAVSAYNLVRAVIQESARRTGLDPRQYSFTQVQDLINTWLPNLASITSEGKRKAEFERMMKYVAQCRLYKRKKRPPYPRTIWMRRRKFPTRKGTLNPANTTNASQMR
jgi:putative transposase